MAVISERGAGRAEMRAPGAERAQRLRLVPPGYVAKHEDFRVHMPVRVVSWTETWNLVKRCCGRCYQSCVSEVVQMDVTDR